MEVTAALRQAESDRPVDPPSEGIGRTGSIRRLVAKEGNDVARGRKAQTHHLRVLGDIDEFVDRASVKTFRPLDRNPGRTLECDAKARRRRARIGLALTHADFGVDGIEVDGRIAQRADRRIVGMVEDKILTRQVRYARRDWRRKGHAAPTWNNVALPAAPHHGVAVVHQKAVAGVRSLDEIVGHRRDVVEQREPKFAAAIEHLVKQRAVAIGGYRRPQDFHVGDRLDLALRVTRRAIEIDDDAVMDVVRCDRNCRPRDNPVVGADREGSPFECRRFHLQNLEFNDFGGARTGENDGCRDQHDRTPQLAHGALSHTRAQRCPPQLWASQYRDKAQAGRGLSRADISLFRPQAPFGRRPAATSDPGAL